MFEKPLRLAQILNFYKINPTKRFIYNPLLLKGLLEKFWRNYVPVKRKALKARVKRFILDKELPASDLRFYAATTLYRNVVPIT